jgi:hypothetical protein
MSKNVERAGRKIIQRSQATYWAAVVSTAGGGSGSSIGRSVSAAVREVLSVVRYSNSGATVTLATLGPHVYTATPRQKPFRALKV